MDLNQTPRLRMAIFIAIAWLALLLRLPQLADRPMHTDEAVNAYITGDILQGAAYHYDPQDRHGPALYALAAPVAALAGAGDLASLTETSLRLTPVICGSTLIVLFGLAVEMFGFLPCLVAALLFAVAPLPVYYNRYFIHETPFLTATFGLLVAGWRAWQRESPWAAGVAGACAALMLASKETAVIAWLGLITGVLVAARWTPLPKRISGRTIGVGLAVFAVVSLLLFTWFGRHWAVFTDLWPAVNRFAARAGGEGHEKPFTYYLGLLDGTFMLFLLALAGVYAVICEVVKGSGQARLAMIAFGVVSWLVYSAIPYKQPWLALNLWLPFAFLVGFGVDAIWDEVKVAKGRWVIGIGGVCLLLTLGAQTQEWVFQKPAEEKNPLAYAHTTPDILRLAPRIEE
ncbi:MAG TPA: flippase activity-associated protein Agl23, partial [Verrucomicrobiae bacterium]